MSNIFKAIGDGLAKTVNWIPHTTEREKRAAMAATTAQIGYYQEAKNQLTASANADAAQKATERQRINEKQIRAKRAVYRSRGSVASQQDTAMPASNLG